MAVVIGFATILLMILLGFSIGRRTGYRAGIQRGRAEEFITLRQHGLEQGVCPICDKE